MSEATNTRKSLLRNVAASDLSAVDSLGAAVTYSFSLIVNTGTNMHTMPISARPVNVSLMASTRSSPAPCSMPQITGARYAIAMPAM